MLTKSLPDSLSAQVHLARHSRDPATVDLLVTSPHEDVRRALAKNYAISETVQQTLFQDPLLLPWLAENRSLTPTLQSQFLTCDTQGRTTLARNISLTPLHQLDLARDSSLPVRTALAANPGIIPDAALVLASDSSSSVRFALSKNPSLVLTTDFPAHFYSDYFYGHLKDQLKLYDISAEWHPVLDGWEGSLSSLLETVLALQS